MNITEEHVINLNALPIKIYDTDYILNDELVQRIKTLKYIKKNSGFKLSESTDVLNEIEDLKEVKDFMNLIAEKYAREVLEINNEIYMTQSWITINDKGANHHMHHHPNAFFSLVYYVKSKNVDLNLWLNKSSLQKNFNFQYDVRNNNMYNSSRWKIPTKTGRVVLFLGDLNHHTSVNELDEEKIILGANYFLKGALGTHKEVSFREI